MYPDHNAQRILQIKGSVDRDLRFVAYYLHNLHRSDSEKPDYQSNSHAAF